VETHDPLDLDRIEQSAEERDLRAKLEAKVENDDFMWLMSSKRGRRTVWRALERSSIYKTSFNSDAMQMAFAEGMKQEGLRITAQIFELCPERYSEMADEARQRRRKPIEQDEQT
jgi:hypothetical protein